MSANPSSIRILAVDDHSLVREGIAGLVAVQSDMTLVAEASNGYPRQLKFRHLPVASREISTVYCSMSECLLRLRL